MAGLEALRRRWPGAQVVCSAACNEGIQSRRQNMSLMMEVYLSFRGKPGVSYAPFVCRPAEVAYDLRWETVWRGHRLTAQALPGHTPGSACIGLDGERVFTGDYLIPGEEVILRLPGGDEGDYRRSARPFLAGLPLGMAICPGHGAPYTLTEKERSEHGL